ncbi:lipid A deacylase LpxR family protein [Microbulbifer thermotolerans]|uniref:lipid A deacylase LpxR family protein n=1 Tax=Microbulbifer thermotolerans TaxID=252514 RepID=UPI000944394E|nr:lipid A deacylase LpxR family protein [Microbulbifer thermotolerans]
MTWCSLLFAGAVSFSGAAPAAEAEPADTSLQAITVRIDNDFFAGRDRGYSNGVEVGFVSQTVDSFQDARLPSSYRLLNRVTGWLQPQGYTDYNMTVSVSHGIFTPTDWEEEALIEDDRPYAGALIFEANYNGRNDNTMRATGISLGIVGPSAQAEELQRAVHSLLGSDRFRGWDNQLSDEVVFRLHSHWLHRYQLRRAPRENWKSDLILHGGGNIGNLLTSANTGVEWRFGPQLPDNFGSAPLLPAALNTAPERSADYSRRLKLHGFVSLDLQLIAHDITLDGNLWKDSHSVDREPFVAQLGVGVAGSYGMWQFAFARFVRTREFAGQSEKPQLGSVTIQRNF